MNNISKSSERYSFQKEKYLERCNKTDETPSAEYLEMFESFKHIHDHKFDDPESRINNMEYDLLTNEWILEKVRNSEIYAQNLYAAMCNTECMKNEVWPVLKQERWSCSWRYAGGIIADMRQEGDYIDWYCSGIRGGMDLNEEELTSEQKERLKIVDQYVGEGYVTDEIRSDLLKLGWIIIDDDSLLE